MQVLEGLTDKIGRDSISITAEGRMKQEVALVSKDTRESLASSGNKATASAPSPASSAAKTSTKLDTEQKAQDEADIEEQAYAEKRVATHQFRITLSDHMQQHQPFWASQMVWLPLMHLQ